MKIALFSLLFLSSCAAPTVKFNPIFRKDRGSNLTVLFFGPHDGMVTRAAKGYKVGQYSNQWESVTDSGVWTEPDWSGKK